MILKKSLVIATILIGISTLVHPTIGKQRVIYMKSDNSRPVPLSETKEHKNAISMTIYYETLCPDSLDFFRDQLVPIFENLQKPLRAQDNESSRLNPPSGNLDSTRRDLDDLESLLDINLIPYGKAMTLQKSSPDYTFLCQHGPLECEGNRLHACTIDALAKIRTNPNEENVGTMKLLNFLVCTMKFLITPQDSEDASSPTLKLKSSNLTTFSVAALDHCFVELSTPNSSQQLRVEIETCLKPQQDQGQGSYLLKKYGDITQSLNPQLYFVPWMTFNGVWTKKNFQESRTNLKKVLCSLVTPKTLQLYDVLDCRKYLEEAEHLQSVEKTVIGSRTGRKVGGLGLTHFDHGTEKVRGGRGVGSGEGRQINRKGIILRRRPHFGGRDRRGFLHANNDMDLGGGVAWRWRTNVHSNPGQEWRWRKPVAVKAH